VTVLLLPAMLAGCKVPAVTFPDKPVISTPTTAGYDTDADGRADFFLLADRPEGRFTRIGYDRSGDGKPDHIVRLNSISPKRSRHLVLVLDGIPFDVAAEFRRAGRLRIFDPPVQMVSPYPVMTDLSLEDVFAFIPCEGTEAQYYHRTKRRVVGGTDDYLAGKNEPFAKIIDYRTDPLNDGLAYLYPTSMFDKELHDAKRVWDRRDDDETILYIVSAAALGSRQGKEGQLYALRRSEQFILQVLHETGGLVKITFLADHGQTNVPCEKADLAGHLRSKGWKLTPAVRGEKDVALVSFGLVTFAALNTRKPAELSDDLLAHEAVTLASYVEGGTVVVRTRDAKATIHSDDGKTFEYKPISGDPLKLAGVAKGRVDGRAILKATAASGHEYPDALYRLWRAHFALMENPPDVIVDLADRYYSGSDSFGGSVKMLSTHGSLNRASTTTFFMTTAGKVAGPLRSEDVPEAFRRIYNRPFPYGR